MARARERMLNLISHQGTATLNHRSASLHTHGNGYDNNNLALKKSEDNKCCRGGGETMGGCYRHCKTVQLIGENCLLKKVQNYLIIHSSGMCVAPTK